MENAVNQEDEGEVDLNEADIEVRPEKMPTRHENTTSSSISVKQGKGGRIPNFMKKTVSSHLKQV